MQKYLFLLLILFSFSCKRTDENLSVPYLEPRAPEIRSISYYEENCSLPYSVRFSADVSNLVGAEIYEWTFDGQKYYGAFPTILVDSVGDYDLKLKVYNSVGEDIFEQRITYSTPTLPIIAYFDIEAEQNNFRAPALIRFRNFSQRSTQFIWDLGNGFTSTLRDPEFLYTNPGVYNITLKAICEGDTQTYFRTLDIKPAPKRIRITYMQVTFVERNYIPENYDDVTRGADFWFTLSFDGQNSGYSDIIYDRDKFPVTYVIPDFWNGNYLANFDKDLNINVRLFDRNNSGDFFCIEGIFDGQDLISDYYPVSYTFRNDNFGIQIGFVYED